MALALYGFVERRRRIERAGISYEFSVVKDRLALGLSTLPVLRLKEVKLADDEAEELLSDWMDPEDGKYKRYIARLDPNDAKDQDHYKVLGLSKLRYQSTQAQIRTAYRHKVLIYHPDKGKADETELRNEAVFACIQKAYEQLGLSEEKRRAFDSVDPKFDEDIPDGLDPGQDFFRVLGPVFERNARFSINQPVPLLGDEKSDRISVEHFYDFWFDWKSWREFSYLDAEDKTRGEDRYERREIEKQNKIEREKRRKRDLKRVSALVELAYSKDPRVARFKEEDRRAKAQAKEHKRMERQRREQAEKEEQRQRDEAVEEERRQREAEDKKAAQLRQQKKKVLAAQRRRLRELAAATNYWAGESPADNARQQQPLAIMEQIERVCLAAEFEELNSVCEQLSAISVGEEALRLLRECARKEEPAAAATNGAAATKNGNTKDNSSSRPAGIWSNAELQLLVKAVNLYPPGTQQRWMQVAEYVSYHGGEQRTERDVIKQVKLLKSDTMSTSSSAAQLKDAQKSEEINAAPAVGAQKSEANSNRSAAEVPAAATMTAPAATNAASATAAAGDDEWDAEQQRQLERALKATPATDPERWEKIAAQVQGKTKKQCVRRYKRLAELVKQAKTGGETAQ